MPCEEATSECNIYQEMIIARCGDYRDMKGLTQRQEQVMFHILTDDTCWKTKSNTRTFSEEYILNRLQQKDEMFITMLYLYCNWRVWRTYECNLELAKKYQKICDFIDARVFEEWSGTEALQYFIRETD